MARIRNWTIGLLSLVFTVSALTGTAATARQLELEPAPRISGYTGYEHGYCTGKDGSVLSNVFGSPEQCASLCTQLGEKCVGFIIMAGEGSGVKELEEGILGNRSWPWGTCYLRAGPAPMNVVDWPLDCMERNPDGSYTMHREQNCWGKAADIFRGKEFGGGPFGVALTDEADSDSDSDSDSEGDSDSDSDSDDEGISSIPSFPWAKPTPEAESEELCQEFCTSLGPQCTAVMRTPADGQCYFRSSAGIKPLVDWEVRCYLKN